MLPTLIAATALVLASPQTRGYGLLLFALLLWLRPGVFIGLLVILAVIHLFNE